MAKKTTKTPDGTTGMKLDMQEVNWGNAASLFMTMVGNINANLLDIKRDVAEMKERGCHCRTTKRKT
jgi:hypothetical protein